MTKKMWVQTQLTKELFGLGAKTSLSRPMPGVKNEPSGSFLLKSYSAWGERKFKYALNKGKCVQTFLLDFRLAADDADVLKLLRQLLPNESAELSLDLEAEADFSFCCSFLLFC